MRDRIVELVRVRGGDLVANGANWRRHPAAQPARRVKKLMPRRRTRERWYETVRAREALRGRKSGRVKIQQAVHRYGMLAWAIFFFVLGLALAIRLPSQRRPCDCPPPRGATLPYTCPCPVDHLIDIRIVIVLFGTLLALSAYVAHRRRRWD